MTTPKNSTKTMTRRTLAQGIAWAAPTAIIAAQAPAFAASKCEPSPNSVSGSYFQSGRPSYLSAGSVTMNSVPEGVYITSITVETYVEQKVSRADSTPGYPAPDATASGKKYVSYQVAAKKWVAGMTAGQTHSFYDSKNGGYSNSLTYLGSGIRKSTDAATNGGQWSGTTWGFRLTWSGNASGTSTLAGDPRRVTTTTTTNGCSTLTLPEMGQLNLSATYTTQAAANVLSFFTVVLSDGTTMNWSVLYT